MMEQNLETRLAALLVKDRLHELEVAYCRGFDRRDLTLLKSIYFDDALEDHGDAWRGTGHEWAEFALGSNTRLFEITAHYVLNEWYLVHGLKAQGETHRISYHREAGGRELTAAARTLNRYECRNGVWKIVWRSVTRDWVKEGTVHARPPSAEESHFALPRSQPGPEDRSYNDVPWFRRGTVDAIF